MYYYFKDIPVNEYFNCNGNLVKKVTTRTGHLIEYNKRFYFDRLAHCEYPINKEVK